MSENLGDMPMAVSIPETARHLGCGLTKTHEIIAAGFLDARKIGKRTVVMTASIKGFLDALPKADIRQVPRRRTE